MQPLELRPSIILIDEPELGLHPAAITLLAAMIQSASVNTQIIAPTQSPILLDYFEPEDVLVAERDNGSTIFNRLEPEALRVWLEDYSLGQLWEKNYLGGRPLNEKIIH
jgi:predicted ATPase